MKKLLSLTLAFCLLLTLAAPAFAADSMDNFQKVKTYENNFSDVPADHWAASSIATCYEYGLMNGADAGTFNLSGNLTVAEALVMAAQIDQIYVTGTTSVQPSNEGPWYQSFVDHCVKAGIIHDGDFSDFNAKATRAQMAGIFAHALPKECLSPICENRPMDVLVGSTYWDEILTLYHAGILSGNDDYGRFYPDNTISRAEAAVILSRVALPGLRNVKVLLQDISLTNGVTMAVPQDVVDVSDPETADAVYYHSYHALISANFDTDPILRGIDVHSYDGYLTELMPSLLDELLSNYDSMETKSLTSDSVTFGTLPALRMKCTVETYGQTADVVIYMYIKDETMGTIIVGGFENPALVNTMANSVRINDAGVSPTL